MLIVAILLYIAAIVALAHALERPLPPVAYGGIVTQNPAPNPPKLRPECDCRNSADREIWMEDGHMGGCASRQC